MIQAGIKPVYVFDGKAPKLKRDELDRRGVRRDDAGDELKKAQEAGDQEAIERYSKRTVKVTKTHVDDCKKLLRLMGVPYIEVCALRSTGQPSMLDNRARASALARMCQLSQGLRVGFSDKGACRASNFDSRPCHLKPCAAFRLHQKRKHSAAPCARPTLCMAWPQMTWTR
jgi:5'-3' exonuclease